MRVEQFTDEYELVAPLYGVRPVDLLETDRRQGKPPQRWLATEEGHAIGAAVIWLRPDDRLFLKFQVHNARAYGPLSRVIIDSVGRSVFATCDDSETDQLRELQDVGFRIETTIERFAVPFADMLALVDRAWLPTGYEIRSVVDVDERRALELDNQLRNLVPGTDGWGGNLGWFRDELQAPEFDPSAYLIAVEEATDAYVGLVRIWRNSDGPRLGLIGVLPEHRGRPIAAALLKKGLGAASAWGFTGFATETSPSNPHTYPRLRRMGIAPLGRFHQLTHP